MGLWQGIKNVNKMFYESGQRITTHVAQMLGCNPYSTATRLTTGVFDATVGVGAILADIGLAKGLATASYFAVAGLSKGTIGAGAAAGMVLSAGGGLFFPVYVGLLVLGAGFGVGLLKAASDKFGITNLFKSATASRPKKVTRKRVQRASSSVKNAPGLSKGFNKGGSKPANSNSKPQVKPKAGDFKF